MKNEIPKIVEELMRFRAASNESVAEFRRLEHNKHLCPFAERQLNRVLDCFLKFRQVAYDVQGIHDRGTDVLLRYATREDFDAGDWACLSLQLKSFGDLEQSTYLKDLKSQLVDATSEYGDKLTQYYILLCADPDRQRGRVREVKKAFSNQPKVTIVDPYYSHTFLRLGSIKVGAVVDSILREGDQIRRKAINAVLNYSPTEAALVLAATYLATFSTEPAHHVADVKNMGFVGDIYKQVPDFPRDHFLQMNDVEEDEEDEGEEESFEDQRRPFAVRLEDDIEQLDGDTIDMLGESSFRVRLEGLRPLQAMMLDAQVRYDYEGTDLLKYVFGSLEVLKRSEVDTLADEPSLRDQ